MWLSDTILARITFNKVITSTNTCYELVGPIDSNNQKSFNISSKFEDGFPDNWEEVIQDHLK